MLDACVLVPYNLTSFLLTCAEHDLFEPRWSALILNETHRALTTKLGLSEQRVVRRVSAMRHAFPEAEVVGFNSLIPDLRCHPKDRHVLAAAVASDADVIVTFNLDDFPDSACAPHGVVAVHPEEFLMELLVTNREQVGSAVEADAARRSDPPARPAELLGLLAATVPTFANSMHAVMSDGGEWSQLPAYVSADPADSPLGALADGADLTDPLHVAALWWLALLEADLYAEQLHRLTHAPAAWGDFAWAAGLVSGKSIASKVYYAVDNPAQVAVVRFVPEVAQTARTFASFALRGVVFLTLCRYEDGTWRVWGLGPRMVSAKAITG